MTKRVLLFSFVLVASVLCAAQTTRRLITDQDLFRFVWIADPQISPDGSEVAFVRVSVNKKRTGYDTELWKVSTDASSAPIRLTSGPHDGSPRWSPDGKRLAFVRGVEKDGKPEPAQLCLLPMNGGEAWTITSLPKGVHGERWAPDGKTILFVSDTTPEDLAKAKRKAPAGDDEHESDVRVITRALYRDNDEGYIDFKRHSHIWTIGVPTSPEEVKDPKQITSGEFDEDDPAWSVDGSHIYFASTRVNEPYYEPAFTVLYAVPAGGGEIKQIMRFEGGTDSFSLSPDGKQIAFAGALSQPVLSYTQPHLWIADLATGKATNIAPRLDSDVDSDLIADQHPPRGGAGHHPQWSADGRSIVEVVAEKGTASLRRFDISSGTVTPITHGNQEVITFTATPSGMMVALVDNATEIGDLYSVASDGSLKRLTNVNQQLWSELNLTPPEEFWYTSFDGKKIQAWIQKPPDFDPSKKYPLILDIHGGPHAAYGYSFFHEFHWMAAKGYVVLYPNPRGSTSYGQDFANIIQYHYPGDDYKDLMAGVDEVIKRGYVDPTKLGVTGGSGGGVLTNWIVGHTDRFAAAVSQRSIADWSTFWYTADFTMFTPFWFKGSPWQQRADFDDRSPLTYIDKVKTPLMLVEGESDFRTPPAAGGEMMFRALKYQHKPVVMVRFPGESHELSRSGQPWHRVERLDHIVNWFDIYLEGKPNTLYDLGTQQSVKAAAKQ